MSIHNNLLIHPTAIVEDGARIGENVQIGAYCIIGAKVTIGDNTKIQNHSCIYGRTTLGQNNNIFSHTVLGSEPQDLKYDGEDSELIVGSNNTIREFCLINLGTKSGGNVTKIGNNNLIMSHTHIAHDCIINNNCIMASNAIIAGHVEMQNYSFVGGSCAIHQFVHIGEYAILAGGSVLTQDLPPFCLAQGNRAIIKSLNVVGIRRNLPKEIDNLKKAFKAFFRENANMKENVEDFYKNTDNEYIKSFCEFIKNSKRGIPIARDIDK